MLFHLYWGFSLVLYLASMAFAIDGSQFNGLNHWQPAWRRKQVGYTPPCGLHPTLPPASSPLSWDTAALGRGVNGIKVIHTPLPSLWTGQLPLPTPVSMSWEQVAERMREGEVKPTLPLPFSRMVRTWQVPIIPPGPEAPPPNCFWELQCAQNWFRDQGPWDQYYKSMFEAWTLLRVK